MRGMQRRVHRRGGFTLLEVLLVVVILGMLAALVVPNLIGAQADAQKKLAKQLVGDSGALATQIGLYRMAMGKYPDKLEDLTKVPDDATEKMKYGNNGEPYIKDAKQLKDPWGSELQYKNPGEVRKDSYDLYSWGPDMKEGGGDDIGNWPDDTNR